MIQSKSLSEKSCHCYLDIKELTAVVDVVSVVAFDAAVGVGSLTFCLVPESTWLVMSLPLSSVIVMILRSRG